MFICYFVANFEPILSNSSFHMEAAGIANNNMWCDSFLDSPQLESTSIEEVNDDYDIGIDLLNEADEEYDTEMSLIVDEIMGTGDKVNVDIISNVTKFKPKVLKVSSGSVEDAEEIVDQISNKRKPNYIVSRTRKRRKMGWWNCFVMQLNIKYVKALIYQQFRS